MSGPKHDAIRQIEASLAEAEAAIRNHPERTVKVYEEGLRAFHTGQDGVAPEEAIAHARAVGLTVEEFRLVRLYIVAMAFMAAWYHRHGDKAYRDKAAHAASNLVATAGVEPENAFKEFLKYEHLWRRTLAKHRIGRRSGLGCAPVFIAIALSTAAIALG